MDHFTVTEPQIVHNDISANDIFLNFQKADFDSVWGDFSSSSLSDSEQVLFEQPKEVSSEEIGLWKELESIQPVFKHSSEMENTIEMEGENKFDPVSFYQVITMKFLWHIIELYILEVIFSFIYSLEID